MSLRTFFAIELPPTLHPPLQQLQENIQARIEQAGEATFPPNALRWTRPANIHLTLRFLGETEEAHLAPLAQTVGAAVALLPPMPLQLQELGSFPTWSRLRVLWIGVGGIAAAQWLQSLQRRIEEAVQQTGYAPDNKPFRPHLTLARMGRNLRPAQIAALGQLLQECAHELDSPRETGAPGPTPAPNGVHEPFTVREIVHLESRLPRTPGGAPVYIPLARLPLTGTA